jgi:hypothetical protein
MGSRVRSQTKNEWGDGQQPGNPITSRPAVPIGIALTAIFAATLFGCAEPGRQARVEAMVEGDPLYRLLDPDDIKAIDDPEIITAGEADLLLSEDEPVLGVSDGGRARAYPVWMLDHHEIVNDRLGETPIAATW